MLDQVGQKHQISKKLDLLNAYAGTIQKRTDPVSAPQTTNYQCYIQLSLQPQDAFAF